MKIVDLKAEEFEDYISRDISLVEFSTEWCMPCKHLYEFLVNYDSDLEIGRINCDENVDLCNKLEVQFVPTIILFSKGEEIARAIGFKPKLIDHFIKVYEHLNKNLSDVEVVKRIVKFARENDLIINVNVLVHVLKYHGERCPCRLNVKKCPCDDALENIKKTGRCYCGLFLRSESK